jgi:transposase-like protein
MPAREIDTAAHHLALPDQIVDHGRIGSDDIGGRAAVDPGQHVALLARDHLVAAGALEAGRKLAHARRRALVGQDGEIGRVGVAQRQRSQQAKRGHDAHSRSHDVLPLVHPNSEAPQLRLAGSI